MRKLIYPMLAAVFLIACEKEGSKPASKIITAPSTQSTQDNNSIENEFDDLNNIITAALEENNLGNTNSTMRIAALDTCYEAVLDAANKTLTLTFDSNAVCLDQKIRSGKIIITYTGRYIYSGSVTTATLQNYVVNQKKLEGTRKVTNQGLDANNNMKFLIEVTNGKLTKKDGASTSWASTRTRLWTKGQNTPLNIMDDEYKISGTASGTDSKGQKFSVVIDPSTPLVYDVACWTTHRMPVSGIFTLTPEGEEVRKIDYGTGACDYSFSLIYKGYTFPITVQ